MIGSDSAQARGLGHSRMVTGRRTPDRVARTDPLARRSHYKLDIARTCRRAGKVNHWAFGWSRDSGGENCELAWTCRGKGESGVRTRQRWRGGCTSTLQSGAQG
jgi:hypothetical protein